MDTQAEILTATSLSRDILFGLAVFLSELTQAYMPQPPAPNPPQNINCSFSILILLTLDFQSTEKTYIRIKFTTYIRPLKFLYQNNDAGGKRTMHVRSQKCIRGVDKRQWINNVEGLKINEGYEFHTNNVWLHERD